MPPQCAGNTKDQVRRYRLLQSDEGIVPGRVDGGGIWFRGLCADCNSTAGGYDDAYGALVNLLPRPDESHPLLWLPGKRNMIGRGAIRPGAIARSMMFAAFALNPGLRNQLPDAASRLLNNQPIDLRLYDRRLHIANAIGEACRVHGAVAYIDLLGPRLNGHPLQTMTDAAVHLRPLAWMLEIQHHVGLPHVEGWRDISPWLLVDPDDHVEAHQIVPPLAAVTLASTDKWALGWADEINIVVEGIASFPGARSFTLGGVEVSPVTQHHPR